MSDPANQQPADDLYDVEMPEASPPGVAAGSAAGSPSAPARPRRPQRAAAPPPPFKVPAPNVLDLLKAHLARAFAVDGGPERLVADEQRTFEVTKPAVATELLAKVLLWRRASLTIGGLMLALALLLLLVDTATSLSAMRGSAVLMVLVTLTGLGVLGWAVWQAFAGWDFWARHRGGLRLGLLVALAAVAVGSVLRGHSLYLFALAPCLLGLTLGTVRMAGFAKAAFPGARAPGWVLTFAFPVHAALAFSLLIMAWQGFGSAVYLLGALTVAAIPVFHWRAAAALSRPAEAADVVATLGAVRLKAWLLGGMALLYFLLGAMLALDGGTVATLTALLLCGAFTFVGGVVAFDLYFELQTRVAAEATADADLARSQAELWTAFVADAALEGERAARLPGGV